MNSKIIYVPITCYCTSELAKLYNVQPRQMRRKLEPLRELLGSHIIQKWLVKQIEIIFDELGRPEIKAKDIN